MAKNINPLLKENFLKPIGNTIVRGGKAIGGWTKNNAIHTWNSAKVHAKGYGNILGIGKNAKAIRKSAFSDAWHGMLGAIIPGAIKGSLFHIGRAWLFSPTKGQCLSKLRKQYNLAQTDAEKQEILTAIEDIKKLTPTQFKIKHVLDPRSVFKSAALGAAISSLKSIPDAAVSIQKNNNDYFLNQNMNHIASMQSNINRDRTLVGNNPIFK